MTTKRIATSLLAILVAGALAASTAAAATPTFREEDDRLVLANDHVTAVFHEKRPHLAIHPAGAADEDAPALEYRFRDVVEYRDVDGNGAPSANEIVSRLALDGANEWSLVPGDADDTLTLNMTISGPVRFTGGQLGGTPIGNATDPLAADRLATITLLFSLHEAAIDAESAGVTYKLPASSLAYEMQVAKWPFVNGEGDRLALRVDVLGALEPAEGAGIEGAEVLANETKMGALTWSPTAIGNTTEGEIVEVPVRAMFAKPDENGLTPLSFTYDAANLATLSHDASVGSVPTPAALEGGVAEVTGKGMLNVPGPGVIALLVGVAAVAALVRRR